MSALTKGQGHKLPETEKIPLIMENCWIQLHHSIGGNGCIMGVKAVDDGLFYYVLCLVLGLYYLHLNFKYFPQAW